jgi:hypothetical protein
MVKYCYQSYYISQLIFIYFCVFYSLHATRKMKIKSVFHFLTLNIDIVSLIYNAFVYTKSIHKAMHFTYLQVYWYTDWLSVYLSYTKKAEAFIENNIPSRNL